MGRCASLHYRIPPSCDLLFGKFGVKTRINLEPCKNISKQQLLRSTAPMSTCLGSVEEPTNVARGKQRGAIEGNLAPPTLSSFPPLSGSLEEDLGRGVRSLCQF